MNLLYLSEDYSASKVHHELIRRLADSGINVSVFTVMRISDMESDIRNTYESVAYKIFSYPLTRNIELPYRVLFGFKKKLKYSKLIEKINPKDVDIVHAATLFSEGIVAYELYKKHRIPYTVAVRGTDIGLYLSKMPHLWEYGKNILRNASKIIFISPVILSKFKSKFAIRSIFPKIQDKCIVIPNGIEDFWIENRRTKIKTPSPRNILYIGRFDNNKNVARLVKAVISLRKSYPNLKLNLVGGGDSCHDAIMDYCRRFPDTFTYYGKIYDKDKLLELIRSNHIFAMVSHSETFGLVYLEALSQGLPILYTSGQGIDESVPESVGEKASSRNLDEITYKLNKLIANYDCYSPLNEEILAFSWQHIAATYMNIFNKILYN